MRRQSIARERNQIILQRRASHLTYPRRPLTRRGIVRRIEALIVLLDSIDGDPDIESGQDEEPELGWAKTNCIDETDDREDAAT